MALCLKIKSLLFEVGTASTCDEGSVRAEESTLDRARREVEPQTFKLGGLTVTVWTLTLYFGPQ